MISESNGRWCRYAAWVLVCILLGAVGCSDKYKSSLSEEEYQLVTAKKKPLPADVLAVSSEKVTVNDVAESPMPYGGGIVPLDGFLAPVAQRSDPNRFKTLAVPTIEESVENKITDILLYQKAKKEAADNVDEVLEKAAERRWREFILENGGDEAVAEEKLRSNNITREQFKESNKRMILSQYHAESKVPSDRPISHKELIEAYEKLKDARFLKKPVITFSLIDIQPQKLQVADPTVDRTAKARLLAEELTEQLKQGMDFYELAKAYSHGIMRQQGGRWRPRDPESLAPPYDVLAAVAESMDAGQTSKPIEARDHIFIMKLEDKQKPEYLPFNQVQPQLENYIVQQRRKKATDALFAELSDQAAAGKIDGFVDICADEIYSRLNR